MAAKIKDVARVAGVSTATVSRALSRPETVAEETRKMVLEAARQTGYRVNLAARSLRSRQTGAIVVLVPNLGNPFFSLILSGMETTLAEEKLSVLVVDTKQSHGDTYLFHDYLHHSRTDGVICLDGALSSQVLSAHQDPAFPIPVVFACEWHEADGAPSVRVNNRRGAITAVRHLAELGHRKIGYINGPADNVLSQARSAGLRQGLAENGLECRDAWVFPGDFSVESGIRAAEAWLDMEDRPTAFFCANDEAAMGLISKFSSSGVRVPEDVSIVGFDDIALAQHFIPPLTTISQPRSALGVCAARVLIDQIKHKTTGEVPAKILPVELVVRNSTGPAAIN